MSLIITTMEQGLIYGILALGVYITYKILDFPDLTVDGSFPLGAAVTAALITRGVNPYLTLPISFLAGAVISLAILIFCGNPAERLRYLTSYLEDYLRTGIRKPYYHRGFALENFHFTIPVFMSVMLYAGGIY